MAGGGDPNLWEAVKVHLPWIAALVIAIASTWSALVGWTWRRQTQRIDDHARRLRTIEREKVDRSDLWELQKLIREDVKALHEKMDRLVERRSDGRA